MEEFLCVAYVLENFAEDVVQQDAAQEDVFVEEDVAFAGAFSKLIIGKLQS